jgi:hypothetical protein
MNQINGSVVHLAVSRGKRGCGKPCTVIGQIRNEKRPECLAIPTVQCSPAGWTSVSFVRPAGFEPARIGETDWPGAGAGREAVVGVG